VCARNRIQPTVEDHADSVHVDRDLADRFTDLADGEYSPDPRTPELYDQFVDQFQGRKGNFPEIGKDFPFTLFRRVAYRGHPPLDEDLRRIER